MIYFSKYFVNFKEDSQLSFFFFLEAPTASPFGYSFCPECSLYQLVDVSLAISTGLLNVLSQLCGIDTMLGQPLQLLPNRCLPA